MKRTGKFPGISLSTGTAIGRAYRLETPIKEIPRYSIASEDVDAEIERLKVAVDKTSDDLQVIRERLSRNLGENHAFIIDAHILMLKDSMFLEPTCEVIRKDLVNAEQAVYKNMEVFLGTFEAVANDYMLERGTDVRDVVARVILNLSGARSLDQGNIPEDAILVAHDLTPSQTAQLIEHKLAGIATETGAQTSHTAILARALDIPAVAGAGLRLENVQTGDTLIVDGIEGALILNPDEATLEHYESERRVYRSVFDGLCRHAHEPAITTDNHRISITANIEFPGEVNHCKKYGAEGIGLFRTEFLFLNEPSPSEDDQVRFYRDMAQTLGSKVVVRTLDLGGDKIQNSQEVSRKILQQEKIFSPPRAIRHSLRDQVVFRQQIRAVLRASADSNIHLLIPFVTSLEEINQVKEIIIETRAKLKAEGIPVGEDVPLGVVIEIPAAAVLTRVFAQHVDFLSIGTNDLIQYSLAVHRGDDQVSHYYEPLHPGILNLIKIIADGAHASGKKVSVCGEMAREPLYAHVLLGLGVDELSMAPSAIPEIKNLVRSTSLDDCRELALCLASKASATEVREELASRSLGSLLNSSSLRVAPV